MHKSVRAKSRACLSSHQCRDTNKNASARDTTVLMLLKRQEHPTEELYNTMRDHEHYEKIGGLSDKFIQTLQDFLNTCTGKTYDGSASPIPEPSGTCQHSKSTVSSWLKHKESLTSFVSQNRFESQQRNVSLQLNSVELAIWFRKFVARGVGLRAHRQ